METKNILIGGGILAAVIYFATKSKKGTPATEELSSEAEGGSMGGGFMGGGMPLPPTTTTAPVTNYKVGAATAPIVPIITEKGSGGSIVKCPSGYVYNGRACVKAAPVAQSTTSGKTAMTTATTAGSGLTSAPPVSSVGTVGGAVQGSTYTTSSRSPVGQVGGAVVSLGFSGKMPLTLDNLLC